MDIEITSITLLINLSVLEASIQLASIQRSNGAGRTAAKTWPELVWCAYVLLRLFKTAARQISSLGKTVYLSNSCINSC